MDQAAFLALLTTAQADVAQADKDAAALLDAQNTITPLSNAATRSAAQAATSTAAAENALAELLQIRPLAPVTPPIAPPVDSAPAQVSPSADTPEVAV